MTTAAESTGPPQEEEEGAGPRCLDPVAAKHGAPGERAKPEKHAAFSDAVSVQSNATAHLAAVMLSYPEYSLLCLRKSNPLRRVCTTVSHNPWFERFIICCILGNCVTLGLSSNREGFDDTPRGSVLMKLEYLWVAIFSVEALLKIVTMGFVLAPGTYLRDGWNVVDFVVVSLGYVDIFTSGNLTALRTVRVLRPLRAITRVRGMRVLVTSMITSLPMLLDVFLLCALFIVILGLVAVQLFAGALRFRCAVPDFTNAYTTPIPDGRLRYDNVMYTVEDDSYICSGPLEDDTVWYDQGGAPVPTFGPLGGGRHCPAGNVCVLYANPNYGVTSFDHILWAWLTIFQCITQESWTDVMYFTQDAVSWWVWPFFVVLIVFGSFYLVNLALAVLYVQFSVGNTNSSGAEGGANGSGAGPQQEQQQAQQTPPGEKSSAHSGDDGDSDSGSSSDGGSAPGDSTGQFDKSRQQAGGQLNYMPQSSLLDNQQPVLSDDVVAAMSPFRRALYKVAVSKQLELTTVVLIVANTIIMCINWYGMPASVERATNYINYAFTIYFLIELIIKLTAFGFKRYFSDGMNIFDSIVVAISVTELLLDVIPSVSGLGPLSVLRAFRLLRIFRLARSWRELNMIIRAMFRSVKATGYLLLLMLLFMLISALMGMQLFGYKFMFCDYVEGASAVCPLGMRVWGDCPNHFYCYLPCDNEDYGSWVAAPGSFYNDQAYCERFCASAAAAAAADVNATSPAVAAAGGCEYLAMVGKSQVPRAQFDNVFWGLFTVFQLLTTENWNNVMYDGMRTTTPWASMYFVTVMLVGTYLVFNLFIAILLENFAGTFGDGTRPNALDLTSSIAKRDESSSSSSSGGGDGDDSDRESIAALSDRGSDDDGEGDDVGDDGGYMHPLRVSRSVRNAGNNGDQLPPGSPSPWSIPPATPSAWSEQRPGSSGPPWGTAAGRPPPSPGPSKGGGQVPSPTAEGLRRHADIPDSPAEPTKPKTMGRRVVPVDAEGRVPAAQLSDDGRQTTGKEAEARTLAVKLSHNDRLKPAMEAEVRALAVKLSLQQRFDAPPTPTGDRTLTARLSNNDRIVSPTADRLGVTTVTSRNPRSPAPIFVETPMLAADRPPLPGVGTGANRRTLSGDPARGAHRADGADGRVLSGPPDKQAQGVADGDGRTAELAMSLQVRPVSAMARKGHGNKVRPISAKAPVTFAYAADDAASRRASFVTARELGSKGVAASLQRSLKRAVSSIKAIRDVKRNDHLAKLIRGRALFLFGPDHWVRWRAARLVHNTYFEMVTMFLIVASSAMLAVDTPGLDPDSQLARAIRIMDFTFTGCFAVEALLKIVTFGFAFTGKHAYIRNGWNILDFAIVLVGFALIAIDVLGAANGDNLQMLRVLRTLRALRPLRAASRFEGLKAVVNALFAVLPSMANVALVCALFYVIFAILTVNLFKGKLRNCIDVDSGERVDPAYVLPSGTTLTRGWCEAGTVTINASAYYTSKGVAMPPYNMTTSWVNPTANFDNVGVSMLSLFQVATLELWVDIMFTCVDATSVDEQPIWNAHPIVVVFFIFFVAVCSFFVLNLFIGVTLEKFTELQAAAMASSVFVTPQQQTWVDVQKLLLRTSMQLRPARPEEPPWRERLFDFVTSRGFDNFILLTIVVNVLFMAMVHADMTNAWQDCMSYTNLIFTCVFVVEAVLKIAAFGPLSYFRDRWHAFDFFVVLVSIVSVVLDFCNTRNLTFMPVLRVLRIVRVFRLIRRAKGLQRLLATLIQSLPALANVGSVMLLLFFIYGVVGMNLFGRMKYGEYLTRHANFDNFPNALLVLMRMITGESWDGIMQECMNMRDCILVTEDVTSPATNTTLTAGTYFDSSDPLLVGVPRDVLDNQCALSPAAAVIYFPTFVVLCGFILLNLVIAVILDNMISSENDEGLPVPKSLVGQFVDAWSSVDHAASGYIHASRLPQVIMNVDPPVGTRGQGNARSATQAVIMSVDVPIHEHNTVTFLETLHALAGRIAGTELPDVEEEILIQRFMEKLPGGPELQTWPKYTAAHFHAALYVQAAVRGFMARYRMRDMMQAVASKPGDNVKGS